MVMGSDIVVDIPVGLVDIPVGLIARPQLRRATAPLLKNLVGNLIGIIAARKTDE